MRSFAIFFICISLALSAYSQQMQSSIAVYTAIVNNSQVLQKKLNGDWSHTSQTNYHGVGVEYSRSLKKNLSLNAGLQYSDYAFKLSYTPYPGYPVAVPDDVYKLSLVSFPITLQLNLWRYFYLRGGLVFDVQTSKDVTNYSGDVGDKISNQSGIGSDFGVGFQLPLSKNFSVYSGFTNEIHGLIVYSVTPYKNHIGDFGLRAGLRLKL